MDSVPDPSMKLPDGAKCSDCVHIARCLDFGFTWEARTECDFAPSRFVAKSALIKKES